METTPIHDVPDDEVNLVSRQVTITAFYCVYELDQAYGGPEEGGWWYTRGSLLACIPVTRTGTLICEENCSDPVDFSDVRWDTPLHNLEAVKELNTRLEEDGFGVFVNYYSTTLKASQLCGYWQETIDLYFPEVKPHYE